MPMCQPDNALIRLKLAVGDYDFDGASLQRPAVYLQADANAMFEAGNLRIEKIGSDAVNNKLCLVTDEQVTENYVLCAIIQVPPDFPRERLKIISIQKEPIGSIDSSWEETERYEYETLTEELYDGDF